MDHIEIIDDLNESCSGFFWSDKKFLVSRKLLNAYTFNGLCLVGLSGFFKSLSEVCHTVDKQALSLQLYRELLCRCAQLIYNYEGSDYMSNHDEMMEDGLESLRKGSEKENMKWNHFEENYVLCKLRRALKNDKLLIDLVNDSIIDKLTEERKKSEEEKKTKKLIFKTDYFPVDVIEEDEEDEEDDEKAELRGDEGIRYPPLWSSFCGMKLKKD